MAFAIGVRGGKGEPGTVWRDVQPVAGGELGVWRWIDVEANGVLGSGAAQESKQN